MTPWLTDPDVTLYHGDCFEVLRELPDASVHMCATSPPFYGLRDYGVEGQIGLEETPDQWVERLVAVFREVRRVLRDDGTLWVEIGDSYSAGTMTGTVGPNSILKPSQQASYGTLPPRKPPAGCKPKDLLGQPWALAFALRADGWYLRSEIIWHKVNAMPESVTDRPTKAHSTIFLLSKKPRYYFDSDAIREPHQYDGRKVTAVLGRDGSLQHRDGERWPGSGANARSVWTIPTEPTPFAHFATWPQALVRRMILAGTSERGCCPECGKPWVRQTERDVVPLQETNNSQPDTPRGWDADRTHPRARMAISTVGWSPSCADTCSNTGSLGPYTPVPCTVLDPFAGSGTTALVARNHGRHSIGIELNQQYLEIAAKRLQQLSLLA